ncbi:MAG: WXG100 family type VII secretion target [Kibdelosporangium sp.]
MTGFRVDGAQLLAHGDGSIKQSENFAGLATLLEQARVSDDCFGPLFLHFKDKYYDGLRECQDMAKKAAGYLEEISGSVQQTAMAYGATDADNAAGLADIGKGAGGLGDLTGAGDATRKNWYDQASAYGSSWSDSSQDVAAQLKDPGSPPEAMFAAFNARMEQLKTVAAPGDALIGNGLGWLISIAISPLVNFVLEPAVGDPEQMRSTAKGWENVAAWLRNLADGEDARTNATSAIWEGESADAFRAQMTEFGSGARAMAGDINDLKGVLETAADIFDTFVQVAVDIIQEFVLGLIVEWLAALAASWITAGASVAAAGAATTAQGAVTGGRLAQKVEELRRTLQRLLARLERFMQALRKNKMLSGTLERMNDIRGRKIIGDSVKKNRAANLATSYQNKDDAYEAIDNARDMLRKAREANDQPRIEQAYEAVNKAREKVYLHDSRATTSTSRVFGKDATHDEALAQNLVKTGLGYLGPAGTTDTTKAVFAGVLENVPGAAVEWGVNRAYDQAADPSGPDDRKAAQERGFSTDDRSS